MVRLDEKLVFEGEAEIEPEGVERATIERGVGGLDGVLSIDLGRRGRKIKQRGTIRAASREQLRISVDKITEYLDGKVHKLEADGEEVFEDVRMDSFRLMNKRRNGVGMAADYEIEYTQLRT
jgi:hypothetical protein